MSETIDQICKETGVSREEAIFYLEGYKWNVEAAMEACRTKTLPTVENTARLLNSANKIFPDPEASPMMIDTPENKASSSISQHHSTKQLVQSPERIKLAFCSVALGACFDDADAYLLRFNWNLDNAVNAFFDERRSVKPSLPPQPEINPTYEMATELVYGDSSRIPPLPLMARLPPISSPIRSPSPAIRQCQALQGLPNQDAFKEVKIGSSSSSAMDIDQNNTTDDSLILVEDNAPIPDDPAKKKLKGEAIDCGSLSIKEPYVTAVDCGSSSREEPPLDVTPVRMNLGPLFDQVDTPPSPPTTIPITIVLPDAAMTPVTIHFRPDQTVRDIRKAIDEIPECCIDYTLMSGTSELYNDLTQTVARIVAGGGSSVLYLLTN